MDIYAIFKMCAKDTWQQENVFLIISLMEKKIWNTIYSMVLAWKKKNGYLNIEIYIQRFGGNRKEDEENVSEYG